MELAKWLSFRGEYLAVTTGVSLSPLLDELRKLRLHLRVNLQPPVSAWYVLSAHRALKLYRADKLDRRVPLPSGRRITVASAVERWHLDRMDA